LSSTGQDNCRRPPALAYSRYGWYVFPVHSIRDGRCTCGRQACADIGKHPWAQPGAWHGLNDATRDENEICRWWERFPAANVGIATEASGLIVLDIDASHGGEESLAELVAKYGRLDETIVALTGGGGQHFLFAAGEHRVATRAPALGPEYSGVDTRAIGGYIVAPPSLHRSGRRYAWEASCSKVAAPVPEWLIGLAQAQRRLPITGVHNDERIPAGARHDVLVRVAGSLRRAGFTARALELALLALNEASCDPPGSPESIRAIAQDIASRYAPHEPLGQMNLGPAKVQRRKIDYRVRIPRGTSLTALLLGEQT